MRIRIHGAAALLAAIALAPTAATAGQPGATLYTASNAAAGNSVIEIAQAPDGTLSVVAEYPTGGTGTDGGLGNQGAIATDGEFLFVVDAGSDEVSAFHVSDSGLSFADRVPSGGATPVSLTVDRGVLYVLNAGSDSIAGFEVGELGQLTPIPGSVQPLSGAGTGPAQISFTKDGRVLVVTEKATGHLVSFTVDRAGVAGPPQVFAAPGQTPFGFAVTTGRRILVSEAAGGQPGLSSVSSWKAYPDGRLEVIDPAVPTLQTAACWVAVTPDGRFAYTTNTGSNSITGYRMRAGRLSLLDADGSTAEAGAGPIDMAVSPDGRLLTSLNGAGDSLTSFRIRQDGSLDPADELPGLPPGTTGLVAR